MHQRAVEMNKHQRYDISTAWFYNTHFVFYMKLMKLVTPFTNIVNFNPRMDK